MSDRKSFAIVNPEILTPTASSNLLESFDQVESILFGLADDPTRFNQVFNTTFGANFDHNKAEQIRQSLLAQDYSNVPPVEIRTAAELNGALGGFSAQTNTIYLSSALFTDNNVNLITRVLLEEIGHKVDSVINTLDTPGDEGEIFSLLVRGIAPTESELNRLQTENDQGFITIDGQQVAIEMAIAMSGLANISYVENDPALLAASGITLSGGVNYANGYIEFKVTGNADINDQLAILSSASPTTDGAISVVGNNVYYGSGGGTTQLGTIDSTYNGLNGQALRINLTSTLIGGVPIANGDFNNGLTNWTAVNSRVDLGNFLPGTTIPTPPDTAVTYPGNSNGGDSGGLYGSGPWTVNASSGVLRLENTSMTTDSYGVIHGPAAYSDVFSAPAGKVFAFDWQANYVSDDYHVVGYLIDSSNNITIALNSTGTTGGGTASVTIPTTGDYRFVFISGTFDASGGTVAGASMVIDNIITADLAPIDDITVSNLARQITYSSTSENPVASKTVTVSTTNNAAESTTGTFVVDITAVNDAPTVTDDYYFKIQSLTANNAQVTDVNSTVGDDRGGMAVSPNRVFLNGDNRTGSFDATTLGASVGLGLIYDGILQNIATGKIYTLSTDGINPATSSGGTFTHLLGINDATGALDGTSILLSSPITTSGKTGIFSGYNRAAIVSNTGNVFDIDINTGAVTTAGSISPPSNFMYGSENWANWGVAEYFDNQLFLAYRSSSGNRIDRINVSTGATETIGTFSNLGDLASFTVSPSSGKWYFHYESSSQFGNFSEALGYADATFLSGDSITIAVNDNATATPFSNLTVADEDSPNASIAITYTAANGTLAGTGLTGTAGNYILTGANLADVNSKLQALVFTPTDDQVPEGSTVQTTFTLTPNDGTDEGTANTSVVVVATSIDPPSVTLPSSFTVAEDIAGNLTFSGTPFVDESPNLTITLSIADGTITGVTGGGITVGGTATARTFSGTVADLNTYFTTADNITYTTSLNNNTARSLVVTADDGLSTTSSSSTINITPVNDAPTSSSISIPFNVAGSPQSNIDTNPATNNILSTSQMGSVGTIQLSYTLGGAWQGDVYIYLIHDGVTVSLGNGHSGTNVISLSQFAGLSLSGDWNLQTYDPYWPNEGTSLQGWSISGSVEEDSDLSGVVTELATPSGNLTDSGAIYFDDPELTDVHLVSAAPIGTVLGSLSMVKDMDTTGTGTGGKVTWTYSVPASAVEYLALGETKVESFTVTVDDQNGGVLDQQVDVTITGSNDAPTDIALDNTTIDENVVAGTVVGNLSATDPDTGDTHTYSLVSGTGDTDNGAFTIDGSQLKINNSPDFETQNSYSIRVQTSDGDLTYEEVFTITINDLNDAPTDIALDNTAIDENVAAGTVVGNLSTTDADTGDTHTYSLVSGDGDTDNSAFTIDGSQLKINNSPDFETKNSYSIRVQTSDGELTYEEVLTIGINDVVETITGNGYNNTLTGGIGDDSILGLGGNDSLIGGGGDDTLDGGTHNDTLTGGAGDDVLTGGSRYDRFVFTNQGTDTITDFNGLDGDVIAFSKATYPRAATAINPVTISNAAATMATSGPSWIIIDTLANIAALGSTRPNTCFAFDTTNGKLLYDDNGNWGDTNIIIANVQFGGTFTAANFAGNDFMFIT
jgi:VCBS repeat-containing protein